MKLSGREGNELEMRLVGYEFPENDTDPWDSNWLLVSVRVVTPQGTWDVVDPCLTTWEAKHLVRWLVNAAAHDPAAATVEFTEPNLSVTARAKPRAPKRVLMKACFEFELRPPWPGSTDGGAGPLCVELDVERSEVARAAASLLGDLIRFPARGDDPNA